MNGLYKKSKVKKYQNIFMIFQTVKLMLEVEYKQLDV